MIIKNTGGEGLKMLIGNLAKMISNDVVVGVPASKNKNHDGGINMATLAAVHEFGGDVKHGGGTRYQKGAGRNGGAKFISNSFIGPTSGVTGAHTIKIPERSFLRAGLIDGGGEFAKFIAKGLESYTKSKKPIDNDFFEKLGTQASNMVKDYMTNGTFTPLSLATIRKKGSSKPLIDTGALRQSITYEVR